MKNKQQNPLSLLVAIFTLLSIVAIGSVYLSLERTNLASISTKIAKLNREKQVLVREKLDLNARIAKLESPDLLKMHLGALAPTDNAMLVVQNYNEPSGADIATKNVALDYSNKIGTINSARR